MPKHIKMQNIKNRNYFHKNRYFWNKEKAVILQSILSRTLKQSTIITRDESPADYADYAEINININYHQSTTN